MDRVRVCKIMIFWNYDFLFWLRHVHAMYFSFNVRGTLQNQLLTENMRWMNQTTFSLKVSHATHKTQKLRSSVCGMFNQILGCRQLVLITLALAGVFMTITCEFLLVLGLWCYCCGLLGRRDCCGGVGVAERSYPEVTTPLPPNIREAVP